MLRWVAVAVALAFVVAPQASGKGPVMLCGGNGCGELGNGPFFSWSPAAYTSHVRPAAPAPFYKLLVGDYAIAYWVPSTGSLRVADGQGPAIWVTPRPADL